MCIRDSIGTSIVLSTARHQRTDGQTERAIRHLTEILRFGIDYEQSNWVALLPRVVFSINNSVTTATGYSPFFVERGRDPLIPLDCDATMSGRYPEREDTREFADRIWSIEKQVEERIQKVRSFYEQTMDERMRQTKGIEVGKRAWLSAHGILSLIHI